MNKLDKNLLTYISQHCEGKDCQVVMLLYYYGTIAWKDHEAGDWFYKSERSTAEELEIHRNSAHRSYERIIKNIEQGIFPFLFYKVEKHKNYSVSMFKIDKDILYQTLNDSNAVPINESTAPSKVPVLVPQANQYRPACGTGINIITHNKNSMSIRDARADSKPDEQQMVEVSNRQTDDCLKMVEIWNSIIRPRKPETMSTRREQQCLEVLRDHFNNDLDKWREHCIRISQSSWLTGDDFTLYLSWALKPERIEEVRNGKYVDNAQKQKEKALAESSKQLPVIPLDEALSDCTNEVDRKVKEVLFKKLGPVTYAAWIKGRAFEMKGDQICITSCGDYTRKRIEQDFGDQLKQAYAAVYNSLSDCKSSLIDHREGVDVDLLIYGNKPLTSSGDVLWAK